MRAILFWYNPRKMFLASLTFTRTHRNLLAWLFGEGNVVDGERWTQREFARTHKMNLERVT